jgi:glycosyltransferase involved in cell wall biosynthesis
VEKPVRRAICHLIDSNLDTGYFRSIARRHDRERFPVMIGSIAPAGPIQAAMRELKTPEFSLGAVSRRQYPAALWRLVQVLRRENVGILHAHCFDPTWLGLIAARLARVKFVYTRHHSDHHIRPGKHWHTRVDSWCARHADHVIAVSEVTRRILVEIEGAPASRISVVYNGMEPLEQPAVENLAHIRDELKLGPEPVCLMIGRLHEEKGHRFLFEAIPEVISRAGRFVVLLAGDGPHRKELEAEVEARRLQDVVRFLGRRDDVAELISLASFIVLPSLAESFGFALLEAMSLAKPVIASTTGGIPEVVADGETGLLVPQANPKALAEAICRLLLNPELAQSLGEAGRRRSAVFSFESMMSGYEAIYEHVSADASGRGGLRIQSSSETEREPRTAR